MVHPYIKYAEALICLDNGLDDIGIIDPTHITEAIEEGMNKFRVRPKKSYEGKDNVEFTFTKEEKGNPAKGIFLSPHIICGDLNAGNIWREAKSYSEKVNKQKDLIKSVEAKKSFSPVSDEYLGFSDKETKREQPKITLYDAGLATITTLSSFKPALHYTEYRGRKQESYNVCFIPDLPLGKLINFVKVFKRMINQRGSNDLFFGPVVSEEQKNGNVKYKPKRPLIYKGNFPAPPKSSALGSVALLGAIGEFAKEAEYSDKAQSVLEDLKDATIYMIKYGDASTFAYNHHVVDLAKAGKLKTIVDSLYYSILHSVGKRNKTYRSREEIIKVNSEYQKFDLFTSRFLQLFNRPAFQDFLSFRAEYPKETETLFTTYFKKVENMETHHSEIVASAKALGKWINKAAKKAAFEDIKNNEKQLKQNSTEFWKKYQQAKSKFLVELESSAFSARSGDALCMQVIRRAGLLSNSDVPSESSLFMEKTASGEVDLDKAKNLLIAFSRLKAERKGQEHDEIQESELKTEDDNDYSVV